MMEAKLRQMESSTSSVNSLPPKPPPTLLGSASGQYRGDQTSLSGVPLGLTVPRSIPHVELSAHPRPSVEADFTPSGSSATIHTRPDATKPSMSGKRTIPGVKIVKERSK